MFKTHRSLIFIFLISTYFCFLFFINGSNNSLFLYFDNYVPLNNYTTDKLLSTFHFDNFGNQNSLTTIVNFYELLFYKFFGINRNIQLTLIFLKFLILLYLSYYGFKQIIEIKFDKINFKKELIFFSTFFYCFNTYTTIWWHSQLFPLNLLITYSLIPILFFELDNFYSKKQSNYSLSKLCLIIFLMSFGIFLFVGIFMFLIIYFFLDGYFKKKLKFFFKKTFKLFIVTIFVLAHYILISYELIYLSPDIVRMEDSSFGNISGGFVNQFKLLFAWLYYYEGDIGIFGFDEFYTGMAYSLSVFIIFFVIISRLTEKKYQIYFYNFILFFFLFLIIIFFTKGMSEPFGNILYLIIYKNPLLQFIRTPDNKLGGIALFFLILSLVISFQYLLKTKNKLAYFLMFFILIFQSINFFNGEVFYNKNKNNKKYYNKSVTLNKNYIQIINYINDNARINDNILLLPYSNSREFKINKNLFIGPDILRMSLKSNLLVLSDINNIKMKNIKSFIDNDLDQTKINIKNEMIDLGIRYILLRNDYNNLPEKDSIKKKIKRKFLKEFDLVFSNSTFVLLNINNENEIKLFKEYQNFNKEYYFTRDFFISDINQVLKSKLNITKNFWILNIDNFKCGEKCTIYDFLINIHKFKNIKIFIDNQKELNNEKYIFVNIITVLLFTYLFFILTYLICWNLKTKYFRKKFK